MFAAINLARATDARRAEGLLINRPFIAYEQQQSKERADPDSFCKAEPKKARRVGGALAFELPSISSVDNCAVEACEFSARPS